MTALTLNIPVELDKMPLSITLLKADDTFVVDYQDFIDGVLRHPFFVDDKNDSMRNTFELLSSALITEFRKRGFNTDDSIIEAKIVATIRKKP